MKRLLTISILLLTFQSVFAFGDIPKTFRQLIELSHCIMIAQIDNPEDTLSPINWEDTDKLAKLHIKETLKGTPDNPNLIEVEYSTFVVCGGPDNYYPDNETVIIFLYKRDTSKYYSSLGKIILENEIQKDSLKARILDYVKILKITNVKKRDLAILEWLIKCVENKYTRYNGVVELLREGDFGYYFNPSRNLERYKKLTKGQTRRLEKAFFEIDTLDFIELGLTHFVAKENYPKLKTHLLKNLSFATSGKSYYLMKKITETFPNSELQKIFNDFAILHDKDKEHQNQKILIDNFLKAATQQ